MGYSMHLGSQNPTPAATGTSSNSSKPQNILATRNKTKPPPTLVRNIDDKKTTSTRTVWSTAKERGQAIIRAGRSPAKRHPHITTISTTRSNNRAVGTAVGTDSSKSSSTRTRIGIGTTTTATALQPPPPPPPVILSPPDICTTNTNPSTDDTPPLSPPPPTTTTIKTTTTRLCPHPLLLFPLATRQPPLNRRDQNVAPAFAPVLKENKKMGHDTSLNPSTATSTRPRMPSLSATAARGINRMPLTPKIASASRPPQPQTPTIATANVATTTPLPRRTQQRPVSTIATTTDLNRAPCDDPSTISATPFSPHLNSNVTPRSGSRQSRVDSANSTPNGTPSRDSFDTWESKAGFPFSSPLNQPDLSRRSMVTFSTVSPERNVPLRQDNTNPRDSKFFHASDVKTTRPTSASRMVSPKNPAFFVANSNGIASKPTSPATLSPPLSPSLNQSQENVSSKFMYANGIPELRPTPPPMVSRGSGSGSTVPTVSKGPNVRSTAALQRPVSPSKPPLHTQSSYRNSTGPHNAAVNITAGSVAPTARVQVSPPPPLAPSTPGLRRSGTATSRSSGHSRSGSLVKREGALEPFKPIASPIMGLFPAANLSPTNPPPLTLASIIQAADEFTEQENDASPDDQSGLQSPTKSTGSSADPVIELIANARRERKVQDLQIRNASLEAINRTLERQLRRQTAELRRYRRLSRSSHMSLASTTMSSRVPSGNMSELELESLGLSDLSEEDLSMQDLEDESFSDTDSVSSDLSPSDLAARDAKHRERDEERLKVDLSKHQQILVDSQKINQSIKRCLDWSEELINDGKRALEYKVRVSDIQLGGRVLDPVDEEEENSRLLLLSNNMVPLDAKPIEEVLETSTSWGIEPQDRDSGIELPRDGG
ncbi:hypothetical protein E0Z10_g6085 [Xylaria hypoxylon]|uniref:Uncharacterized protein n=1 Tax=Xylaria hypoxylon TaxID=37992 RepID=A0A4Z0YU90_9PEZI|nr:hypothetical protein E0Z10_g6085 [Xylaria hypoxylon]